MPGQHGLLAVQGVVLGEGQVLVAGRVVQVTQVIISDGGGQDTLNKWDLGRIGTCWPI